MRFPVASPIVLTAMILGHGGAALAMPAGAAAADEVPATGWSGRAVLGVGQVPHYSGSSTSSARGVLGLNATYRSASNGDWHVGTGGLGWSQRIGDLRFGVSLGRDPGRDDSGVRHGGFGARPGHARLQGLGDIAPTPVITLFAAARLGDVPLQVSLGTATRSHRGTQLRLAAPLRFELADGLALRLTPALHFADRATMQAYHGVSEAQAARTSHRRFDAQGGLRSASLDLGLDHTLARDWTLHAGLSLEGLMGDAARSPLTERRFQVRSMAALSYRF